MKAFYHEGQVESEGEKLILVCNFAAIDCIEAITGEDWDDLLPKLGSRSVSTKVLWGLLRCKHEGVTLDEAASIAFGPDQKQVGLVMGDVIRRACNLPGAADDVEAAPAKKKPSGRSKGSGASG